MYTAARSSFSDPNRLLVACTLRLLSFAAFQTDVVCNQLCNRISTCSTDLTLPSIEYIHIMTRSKFVSTALSIILGLIAASHGPSLSTTRPTVGRHFGDRQCRRPRRRTDSRHQPIKIRHGFACRPTMSAPMTHGPTCRPTK